MRPQASTLAAAGTVLGAAAIGSAAVALPPRVVAAFLVVVGVGTALVMSRRLRPAPWLLAAAAFLAPMNAVRVAEGVTAADVALVLTVGALLLQPHASVRHREDHTWTWAASGLLLITAGALVATVANSDLAGLSLLARGAPPAFVTLVLVLLALQTPRDVHRVAAGYAAGAAVSVLVGELLGNVNPVVGRSYGLSVDFNHFGLACVLGFGASVAWAASRTSRGALPLAVAAAGVSCYGVYVSGSRAAAVGLLIAIAVVVVSLRPWGLLAGAAASVTAAVFVTVLGPSLAPNNAFARLLGLSSTAAMSSDLSDAGRDELTQNLLSGLRESPLTGLGWSDVRTAHNHLLQVATGAGLLGVIGYLMITAAILVVVIRATRPGRAAPSIGYAAGALGFVGLGLAQNMIWDRYIWIFLGAAFVATCVEASRPPALPSPSGAESARMPADARS